MTSLLRTRVKFCGLTRVQEVAHAVALGADAIGLVFYEKSARAISIQQAQDLAQAISPYVSLTGLFVNPSVEQVAQVLEQVPITHLQFHGDETSAQCLDFATRWQRPWTRALRLDVNMTTQQVLNLLEAERIKTHFLLDRWSENYGGSGKTFDWSMIPYAWRQRIILSGGLNPLNVAQAITQIQPYAVDVSSGIEMDGEKGVKNLVKMTAFMDAVRLANQKMNEASLHNENKRQFEFTR